jgi:hypothetical protein
LVSEGSIFEDAVVKIPEEFAGPSEAERDRDVELESLLSEIRLKATSGGFLPARSRLSAKAKKLVSEFGLSQYDLARLTGLRVVEARRYEGRAYLGVNGFSSLSEKMMFEEAKLLEYNKRLAETRLRNLCVGCPYIVFRNDCGDGKFFCFMRCSRRSEEI